MDAKKLPPIIDNPLEWQAMIDQAPAPVNLNGSLRFWLTVRALLGHNVIQLSAPELSGLLIHLKDDIWLELKTDEGSWIELKTDEGSWIEYRFVSQDEIEKDHAWAVSEDEG